MVSKFLVKFIIPMHPISNNRMITLHKYKRQMIMTTLAKKRKSDMKWFVKHITAKETAYYKLKYKYRGDWFFKNGKLKKTDAHNFDKMLIDTIFESIGIDDSRLVDWHGKKVQSNSGPSIECELYITDLEESEIDGRERCGNNKEAFEIDSDGFDQNTKKT